MATAIAAVEACRAADVPAQVKWPNDIVVGERKLGGVLCEASLQGTAVQYAIVGVGLNVNDDFRDRPDLRAAATSIQLFTGQPADRSAVLIRLLRELDRWIAETRPQPAVLSGWAARCATVGRTVTVHDARSGQQIASGLAIRLESDGALIVRRPTLGRYSPLRLRRRLRPAHLTRAGRAALATTHAPRQVDSHST